MKIILVTKRNQQEYYNFFPYYDQMFRDLNKGGITFSGTNDEWLVGNKLYKDLKWSWPKVRNKYL